MPRDLPYGYAITSSTSSAATTTGYALSNKAWSVWVTESTSGATTTGGTSRRIWTAWSNSSATTSATTSDQIWTLWTDNTSTATLTTGGTLDIWPDWVERHAARNPRISNEEYQARLQQHREEARVRMEAERREREKAIERAQTLLHENLSDAQREELKAKGFFTLTVIDSETKQRRNYRINRGRHGNVDQVDENGKRLKRFCIHPTIGCPDEDTMLAQKLWLETQEKEFLRVANHS